MAAQVVSMLLRKMPQRMAGSMPDVVKAVVAKLASAESSPLITSLLVVLAQLVHVNAQQLLDFLAAQPGPGERYSCSILKSMKASPRRARRSLKESLHCCCNAHLEEEDCGCPSCCMGHRQGAGAFPGKQMLRAGTASVHTLCNSGLYNAQN